MFNMAKNELSHTSGIYTDPFVHVTEEMSILLGLYVDEVNPSNMNLYDNFEAYFNWYRAKEEKIEAWLNSSKSGSDELRDKYLHPRVVKKLKSIPKKTVIMDIGGATGELFIPHIKKSQIYVNIDPSISCLNYSSEKFGIKRINEHWYAKDNLILIHGALPNSIPIYDKELKSTHLFNVLALQNVKNISKSMNSMFNLLTNGGEYFIVTFDSEKRDEIDKNFSQIKYQDANKTVGDFKLSSGIIKDNTIYYHKNNVVNKELLKYSNKVNVETCGGFFKIFEGIKKSS